MECFACPAEAKKVESMLDGIELICPECGHYGVVGTLVATHPGQKLDTERTRYWLEQERKLNPDRLPVISGLSAHWAI